VCQTVFVIFPAVVLTEDNLDAARHALDGNGVSPGVRIHELDAVVRSAMRATLRTEIVVRTPVATDDRGTWFDPVVYSGHQCVGGSVRYRNKKCSAGISFKTAKHPLTLNRVSPMVLPPTELALVNFDSLVRTTDFFRAALHEHQHGFPAEHAPASDGRWTEAKFLLDMEGRFAAHDVIRDE